MLIEPGTYFMQGNEACALGAVAAGCRFFAFYPITPAGEIAEKIAAHAKQHGALMTAADFAAHTSDWVEPLAQDYRGYTLHELPPNGQGIAALMALGIL